MKYITNVYSMNLQLFATETQTTGTANLSAEMKTFYDMSLLDSAEPQLVHMQFGQKRPIPANGGKVIEFRKFSSLAKATSALTEGVTPDGNSLKVTSINASVDQYGDYVQISDMLELTALDNIVLETNKLLGSQAGRTTDTIVRNEINGGTNVMYQSKSAGDAVMSRADLDQTCMLTVDSIFKAAALLKAKNAPKINGDYVAIIHPHVAKDFMIAVSTSGSWMDVSKYSNPDKIYNGELGKMGGVRFVESSEAKVWADDTCPVYDGDKHLCVYSVLVLGDNAYGVTDIAGGGLEFIVKQKGSAGSADPLNQRSTMGWKTAMVAKRLAEEYMIRIECASSFSTTAQAN